MKQQNADRTSIFGATTHVTKTQSKLLTTRHYRGTSGALSCIVELPLNFEQTEEHNVTCFLLLEAKFSGDIRKLFEDTLLEAVA